MGCTNYMSSRLQEKFRRLFAGVGYNAHAHPYYYLMVGFLIPFLSCFGFFNWTYESDGKRLWVPADSEIMSQYDKVIDYFGEFETVANLLIEQENGDNLLTSSDFDAIFSNWFEYVTYNMSVQDGGVLWSYDDICVKPYPSYPYCDAVESSIFALFGNTPANWDTQAEITAYTSSSTAQALLSFNLGDVVYNETSGDIIGGSYMLIRWLLQSTSDDAMFDGEYAWMSEFEEYFEAHDSDLSNSDDLKVYYFTSRSFGDEIGRVITSDVGIYIATILVMFTYLALNLGTFSCTGARPWLAVVTIVVMLMALVTGYGLGLAFGFTMNSFCYLLPYVLLGVGIDDEILIIESVDRTPYQNGDQSKGGERFEVALEHCGLSISLTSFCSVFAFAIGTNVTMPGVVSFCAMAAIAFFANYVLQFLVFLPILVLDEQRKNANRNFCCACIKHEVSESKSESETETKSQFSVYFGYIGVLPLMNYIVIPLLSKRRNRLIVLVVFVLFVILSIVSLQWLSVTSDTSRLVPDDSFTIDYLDGLDRAFGASSKTTMDIIIENYDISDFEKRSNLYDLFDELSSFDDGESYVIGIVEQWLDGYDIWLNSTLGLDIDNLNSSSDFYKYLQVFANTTEYGEWNDEIIYDDNENPTKLKASKFYMKINRPIVLSEVWPLRNTLNDIISDNIGKNKGFVFNSVFPFSYFEYEILGLTLRNVGSATFGVLFILCFLMDIKMAFFIILTVIFIDVDLFGWMVMCGVSLDALTFLQIVMAVGLTVDYVIHVTHALADAEPEDGDVTNFERKIEITMRDMGIGVVKGAWTTFLGVVSLSFSSSEGFRGFFYLFSGIIVVAVAHGIFFVPAIMGELKCLYLSHGSQHGGHKSSTTSERESNDIRDHMTEPIATAGAGADAGDATITALQVDNDGEDQIR